MDPLTWTILMRSLERLIVVLGGCLAIYCGYRLFLAMPSKEKGVGKFELPGGISIHLSRVGPGVFFSLFGALVLVASFHYGITFKNNSFVGVPNPGASDQVAAVAGGDGSAETDVAAAKPQPSASASYSGVGSTTRAADTVSDRLDAARTVERLNRAADALRTDLDVFERGDLRRAIREAKVDVMRHQWADDAWGPFSTFQKWQHDGEKDPPPKSIAEAVRVYRGKGAN